MGVRAEGTLKVYQVNLATDGFDLFFHPNDKKIIPVITTIGFQN